MAAAAASSATALLPSKTLHNLKPSTSINSPPFFVFFPVSFSHRFPPSSALFSISMRLHRVLAVVDGQPVEAASLESPDVSLTEEDDGDAGLSPPEPRVRPCELYVCNLPRSCDIAELHDIFKPYGTVQSVEVSRNAETGLSRGCGFVTMRSIPEAKSAIEALDGIELGGREVRVRYSADLFSRKKNKDALNTAAKNIVFESPHKAYVGNLPWSIKPEDLRAHFSHYGILVSARLLYDRKEGRNRVYGFISYSTAEELDNAMSSNGEDYLGRTLVVRKITKRSEP